MRRSDQKLLRKHALTSSISGKGNCYDNSAVESLFKSLKAERVWRHNWQIRREVEVALYPSHGLHANRCRAAEYINGFYTPRRKHSALGWKSPVAFEQRAAEHENMTGTATGPVQARRFIRRSRQTRGD